MCCIKAQSASGTGVTGMGSRLWHACCTVWSRAQSKGPCYGTHGREGRRLLLGAPADSSKHVSLIFTSINMLQRGILCTEVAPPPLQSPLGGCPISVYDFHSLTASTYAFIASSFDIPASNSGKLVKMEPESQANETPEAYADLYDYLSNHSS